MMSRLCHVLIVEDDDGVRELLRDLFRCRGFRVSVATDGEMMRPMLGKGDVDLCVIDVDLPGRDDGLILANEAAGFGCGVVLISGDFAVVERVATSGHRFLPKPFGLRGLMRMVHGALKEDKDKGRH